MAKKSSPKHNPALRIAVVQIWNLAIDGHAQYSRLLNSIYCARQCYTYISWDYDLTPTEFSAFYNKIPAVYQTLNGNGKFDWALYLDVDAAITNHDYRIEEIIDRQQGKEIIFAKDINGTNNGVFLIKNTPKMLKYLETSYNDRRFFHTHFPEQSAMFAAAFSNEYKSLLGWEDAMHMNAYLPSYRDFQKVDRYFDDKSFILHLSRFPNVKRRKIFQQLLKSHGIHCQTNEP